MDTLTIVCAPPLLSFENLFLGQQLQQAGSEGNQLSGVIAVSWAIKTRCFDYDITIDKKFKLQGALCNGTLWWMSYQPKLVYLRTELGLELSDKSQRKIRDSNHHQ